MVTCVDISNRWWSGRIDSTTSGKAEGVRLNVIPSSISEADFLLSIDEKINLISSFCNQRIIWGKGEVS